MRSKTGLLIIALSAFTLSMSACGKYKAKDLGETPVVEDQEIDFGDIDHIDEIGELDKDPVPVGTGGDDSNGAGDPKNPTPVPPKAGEPTAPNPPVKPTDPATPPAKKPSIDPASFKARWNKKPDGAKWTGYTLAALGTVGKVLIQEVQRDMKFYCPTYGKLKAIDRAAVWVMLISAVAEKESSFNPKTHFVEGFKNKAGEIVISRGLLQISKESSNGYDCGIKKETDLEDPKKNLTCGVRILASQVGSSHVISAKTSGRRSNGWRGGASYWAVLRNNPKHRWIRDQVRSLEICQN